MKKLCIAGRLQLDAGWAGIFIRNNDTASVMP